MVERIDFPPYCDEEGCFEQPIAVEVDGGAVGFFCDGHGFDHDCPRCGASPMEDQYGPSEDWCGCYDEDTASAELFST